MVPIQFITHATHEIDHEKSALLALEGGCKWIVLRMTGATDEEVEPIAVRLLEACHNAGATFVLDGRVELCKKINADGVHLGTQDMTPDKARELLGHEFLIGGTAHTADDVRLLKRMSADYVHCGPFRTSPNTEEAPSPAIGIEGYNEMTQKLDEAGTRIPVCAFGSVTIDDVLPLLDAGVDGIAVSCEVIGAENPVEMMQRFLSADE